MSVSVWPSAAPYDPRVGTVPVPLRSTFSVAGAMPPLVVLLAGAEARESGWAADAATALAASATDRARLTLIDLSFAAPTLHDRLGAENDEGAADVFLFGASLARTAQAVDGGYRFLPPGLLIGDPAEVIGSDEWRRLREEAAASGESLLAFVHAEADGVGTLADHADAVVVLAAGGEEKALAAALAEHASALAVLKPGDRAAEPVPARTPPPDSHPVEAEEVDEEKLLSEPSFVRRTVERKRRVSPALLALLVLVLGVGGWFGAQEYPPARTAVERATAGPIAWARELVGLDAVEPAPARDSAEPAGRAEAARPDEPAAPAPPAEPVETPLQYSVAIEAHQDYALADRRVRALSDAEPDVSFYLTPAVVDGVLYYRVLAGPAADSAGASRLMDRLFEAGHKSAREPWAIRPTVWAYELGEFDAREAAIQQRDQLRTRGLPSYVVEIPYTSGPSRYTLYAGAFEGPIQAEVMTPFLEKAGLSGYHLRKRVGRPVE